MNPAIIAALDAGINFNVILDAINLLEPMQNVEGRNERPRNENYFENTIPRYNDDLFKEHFRMTRVTYQELLQVVGNTINHAEIQSVDISKKLLFTIWVLAKPESFLAVGDKFGLAKSTGHAVFKQVITVLSNLMPHYIQWPNVEHYGRIANVFHARSRGFGGVIGAIDGCHIPCKQPPRNTNDYYNRKGFHSIILQGVCDEKGRFIDCFIGMPGRMHDARVFRNSPLYANINNEEPLIPPNFNLIGDSAYPLSVNLMTPFRDNGHLTRQQSRFNTKLSSIRCIIEQAFGHLKGRFRRLKYLDIADFELGNKMIGAACVLHNLIINHEGDFNVNAEVEVENYEVENYNEVHNNNAAIIKRNAFVLFM